MRPEQVSHKPDKPGRSPVEDHLQVGDSQGTNLEAPVEQTGVDRGAVECQVVP